MTVHETKQSAALTGCRAREGTTVRASDASRVFRSTREDAEQRFLQRYAKYVAGVAAARGIAEATAEQGRARQLVPWLAPRGRDLSQKGFQHLGAGPGFASRGLRVLQSRRGFEIEDEWAQSVAPGLALHDLAEVPNDLYFHDLVHQWTHTKTMAWAARDRGSPYSPMPLLEALTQAMTLRSGLPITLRTRYDQGARFLQELEIPGELIERGVFSGEVAPLEQKLLAQTKVKDRASLFLGFLNLEKGRSFDPHE